jgi:hypothetical protein
MQRLAKMLGVKLDYTWKDPMPPLEELSSDAKELVRILYRDDFDLLETLERKEEAKDGVLQFA